jgi:hypothetical protein
MNTTNPLNLAQRAAITRKRREAGREAAAKKNSEKQARHRLRAAMRYTGALIALADALKHCPPSRRIAILNAMPDDLHSDFGFDQPFAPSGGMHLGETIERKFKLHEVVNAD